MPIVCRERDCIYQQLGECTLTRVSGAGDGSSGGCAYYLKRGR